MQLKIEKPSPKAQATNSTPSPEGQKAAEMTARMHFYAVRNAGDQLRWESAPRVVKRRDRMVGR